MKFLNVRSLFDITEDERGRQEPSEVACSIFENRKTQQEVVNDRLISSNTGDIVSGKKPQHLLETYWKGLPTS